MNGGDTDTAEALKPIGKMAGMVRLYGVGLLVLGGLSVYIPQAGGMAVSVIVGFLLILGGIARTGFAWVSPGWGSLFLKMLVGILTIVAGGYMIASPQAGSQVLALVLVFFLFVDGITTLLIASRLPPAAGGAWVMLGAIVSLLVGALMWMQWPASGEMAIGLLIGIKLIIDGVELIGIASAAKAAVS